MGKRKFLKIQRVYSVFPEEIFSDELTYESMETDNVRPFQLTCMLTVIMVLGTAAVTEGLSFFTYLIKITEHFKT